MGFFVFLYIDNSAESIALFEFAGKKRYVETPQFYAINAFFNDRK